MPFDAGDIEARLILDRSQFDRELKAAEKDAQEFEKKKRTAKVGLELDTDKAEKSLEKFMRDMTRDKKAKLGLSVDAPQTRKNIDNYFKGLTGNKAVKMTVDFNENQMRQRLEALGRDLRATLKVDAEVDKINQALNGIANIRANATVDNINVQGQTPDLKGGTATYDVKFDEGNAQAQATALAERLQRTVTFDVELNQDREIGGAEDSPFGPGGGDDRTIVYNVEVRGVAEAIAQLQAVQAASGELSGSFEASGEAGESAFADMAQGAMFAAAALPPIATGVAALPGLLMEMAVPMTTIMLGMDGIKAAAQGLRAPFADLKNEISGVFQDEMVPAFAELASMMPALESGFVKNATAVSHLAVAMADAANSGENLKNLNAIFNDTADMVENLSPALTGLVDNFFELGETATKGLAPAAIAAQEVSVAWEQAIDAMIDSGNAEQAIESLSSAIVSLLGVIAPLVQIGVQLMAAIGPALTGAITVLATSMGALAAAFGALPGPIGAAVAALALFHGARLLLGRGARAEAQQMAMMTQAFRNALPAMAAMPPVMMRTAQGWVQVRGAMMPIPGAAGAAGAAAGSAGAAAAGAGARAAGSVGAWARLGSVVGGLPGLAFIGAFTALTMLGGAVEQNRQEALQAAESIRTYGDAFEASGGKINNQIVELTRARAAQLGMTEAMNRSGVSARDLAYAFDNTSPGIVALNRELMQGSNEADKNQLALQGLGTAMQETGGTAAVTGTVMVGLGEAVGLFGTGAAEAVQDAEQLNKEMDQGQILATKLSDAQKLLSKNLYEFGTTADTANLEAAALAATYEAITDDTKTAGEATKVAAAYYALSSDGARNLAAANGMAAAGLKDFEGVIKEVNPGLIDASGNIDLMAKGGLELLDSSLGAAQGIDTLFAATLKSTGSMQEAGATAALARQRFIEMGVAAGVPRDNMNALADSIMAIPTDVKLSINSTDAITSALDVMGLKDAILAVPDNKTVIVKSLTDEAKGALEALGLQVTQLADGTWEIKLNADVKPVGQALDAIKAALAPAADWLVPIDVDPSTGQKTFDGWLGWINQQVGMVGVNAEDRGAQTFAGTVKAGIDTLLGVMGVNAEDRGATALSNDIKAQVDATIGTQGVNAEDRGATGFANSMKTWIDSLTGTEGVNAEDRGATGFANGIKTWIDGLTGTEGVQAKDDGAMATAQGIAGAISRIKAVIKVTAQYIGDAIGGLFGKRYGDIVEPMAAGGILGETKRMLSGKSRATNMGNSLAQIVQPNTWKLVGDNPIDPEAYIPINKSARSREILRSTAARMGYGLIPEDALSGASDSPAMTINDPQWRAIVNKVRENQGQGFDQAAMQQFLRTVSEALRGRGVEHVTIQAPPTSTVKEVVDEAMFRLRHANKGVHR